MTPSTSEAPPAYLRIGKRRLRIPKRRAVRIALGIALVIRGVLPPAGFILLPPALTILSIDIPRVRRWRRRLVVWLGKRRRARHGRGSLG
ncbi:hypothetical protein [Bradyrhizobium sp. LHD-71]|uniref:hypothetical protein n=1 Tax=Bradyrhizobium sp. LHD-71 TaxID=3072141 RepID=UPI00280F18CB|nr:hypothetical protein [Bradyrhizobium sp. LHD-71]MDQ8732304.1 hypothetical protein [Bradyrhizobium sp. LHD-71]